MNYIKLLNEFTQKKEGGLKMKVFITGASGYIGGSVAKTLIDAGHCVYGLVRNQTKVAALQQLGIKPVVGTLDDPSLLKKYTQCSDVVINAANADHLDAVKTFIEALRGTGKSFIHTSGSSVIGDDALGDRGSKVACD